MGEAFPVILQPFENPLLEIRGGGVIQNRRLIHEAGPAAHDRGDLGEHVFGDPLACLGGQGLAPGSGLFIRRRSDDVLHVQPEIPHLQRTHLREPAQVLAIGAHAGQGGLPGLLVLEIVVPPGHHEARGQPLDVPFPGGRMGFVEIIQIEDQIALGCGEEPEIEQMAIAAGLHLQPRAGRGGQIRGHQGGGAPQEGERTAQHPPIADRDQCVQAAFIGVFQDGDGIAPRGRGIPHAMGFAWQGGPEPLAVGHAFFSGAEHQAWPPIRRCPGFSSCSSPPDVHPARLAGFAVGGLHLVVDG